MEICKMLNQFFIVAPRNVHTHTDNPFLKIDLGKQSL
jgi:hypothetical protein